MSLVYTDGSDGRKVVPYENPTPQEGDWAWRRIQDIQVAMSGWHDPGFVEVVHKILSKGLAQ